MPIELHLISDILPGFIENKAQYELGAYDKHPNAIAHQLIAEYVVGIIFPMAGQIPSN